MVHGSMEELLDDISIANNDVIVADDFRDDVNYFKLRRQRVGNTDKKQGLWKTMLIKIGVKHKKKGNKKMILWLKSYII